MAFALINPDTNEVLQYPINPRAAFPMTSFPDRLDETCLPEGCVFVQQAPCVVQDDMVPNLSVELIDGNWSEIWTFTPVGEQ